jgi:hypothetical protein
VIFPWPSRQSRREAVTLARVEKERSRLGAAAAASLRAEIERMAGETRTRAAPVIAGGRAQLRVLIAGQPGSPARMDCPVFVSGHLADCPVFMSGRLAD